MYFCNYGLQKTCLDKCLKIPVSEDPFRSNMVNGPEHCRNLNNSTFSEFFIAFSKSRFNFKNFQRRHDRHSLRIFELMHSEKRG